MDAIWNAMRADNVDARSYMRAFHGSAETEPTSDLVFVGHSDHGDFPVYATREAIRYKQRHGDVREFLTDENHALSGCERDRAVIELADVVLVDVVHNADCLDMSFTNAFEMASSPDFLAAFVGHESIRDPDYNVSRDVIAAANWFRDVYARLPQEVRTSVADEMANILIYG